MLVVGMLNQEVSAVAPNSATGTNRLEGLVMKWSFGGHGEVASLNGESFRRPWL